MHSAMISMIIKWTKQLLRYSNDYIFSLSVEIEVHQLSKVTFFSNELESNVPISVCEGEELGTRDRNCTGKPKRKSHKANNYGVLLLP